MIHRFFNFLRQSLLTVLLVVLLTLLTAGGWYLYQGHRLYKSVTYAMPVSTLYDTIHTQAHYAAYSELPQTYINAVISTEDEHFLTHKGIDPGAILRALAADIRSRSLAEGGSTLTQQEKRLTRKAAEAFAAVDIEKTYSKQQIFEMYANTIYFGNGRYGIEEAAEGYFGKAASQLTDAEAVVLAGLPNAPSAYASSPERARKRTQTVLKRMVKCRVLTQAQADAIAAEAQSLDLLAAA